MADVQVTCQCGHQMRVSEYAVGMTAKCPKCLQPLHISEENVTPIADEHSAPRSAQAQELPGVAERPKGKPQPTSCIRCGRAFRGDWDRYHTDKGILCHMCANVTGQMQPSRPAHVTRTTPDLPPPVADEAKKEIDPRVKFAIAVAAGAVIVITLYYVLTGAGTMPAGEGIPLEAASEAKVHIPRGLMFALDLFFKVLSIFLALYLALRAVENLPSDHLIGNILILAPIALALYIVPWLVGFYPMVGLGLRIGAHVILTLFIANELGLGIAGLVYYFVFRIFTGILVWAISRFVYGGIGLLIS